MRTLRAEDLIGVWERGLSQHPVDRALTILGAACPEAAPEALARLSIGRRDALLFAVRERSFGPRLQSLAECPACGQRVEFAFDSDRIDSADDLLGTPEPPDELKFDGCRVTYRLPNSLDLALVAGCGDEAEAREELFRRCVLRARRGDEEVPAADLPEEVRGALSSRMAERDGVAEIKLDLSCPACGRSWQALFDVASFLWIEISAQAGRLLREVDALARTYGWSESDILSLSTPRRQFYLSLLQA